MAAVRSTSRTRRISRAAIPRRSAHCSYSSTAYAPTRLACWLVSYGSLSSASSTIRSTISRERRAFSMASAAFRANWEMKRRSCMEKATTSPVSFLALMS